MREGGRWRWIHSHLSAAGSPQWSQANPPSFATRLGLFEARVDTRQSRYAGHIERLNWLWSISRSKVKAKALLFHAFVDYAFSTRVFLQTCQFTDRVEGLFD